MHPTQAGPHSKPVHWAVHMNHKNRSIKFAAVAPVLGLHMSDQLHGPVGWMLLALQFLLYPHLAY